MDAERLFRDRLQLLVKHVRHAYAHLSIMEQIELSHDYVKTVFKSAPVFYHFTRKAHYDTAFAHIMRVVDRDKNVVSIHSFLNFIQSRPDIFTSHSSDTINREVHTDREVLKHINPDIAHLRDTYYAHLDKENLQERPETFTKYPLSSEQLTGVLDHVASILNKYSAFFSNEGFEFRIVSDDDATDLLKYLSESLGRDE